MQHGLFLEIQMNPGAKKKGFFGSSNNLVGQEKYQDYFEGNLKKYNP